MKKNILVLGYFGDKSNKLDGQTVKTRDLYRLISSKCDNVSYFDTERFQYDKLSVFELLKKLAKCHTLAYLPAHSNLKYIFPVLFLLSLLFRFKILYFIIGGWLVEYLSKKTIHRAMLRKIDSIYSETILMKELLQQNYKFNNIKVFPNFRVTNYIPSVHHDSGYLKLVFMARIHKNKGIDTVFELGNYIKTKYTKNQIIIDFYGQINPDDTDFFNQGIEQFKFMSYKGVLQPEEIHPILSHYDALILPTHYYTEGLPGSIIDAYISGIPVIVSNWKHAKEFVKDNYCGFIIPFTNNIPALKEKIDFLYNNPDVLAQMKQNAITESKKYSPEFAWTIIKDKFNSQRYEDTVLNG